MAEIDDINVNFDNDDRKINISDNILSGESNIDVKNDDALYGVDLLANKNYSSGNSENGGYSSGEEPTSHKKEEDYDFFRDKEDSLSGQDTLTISAPASVKSFICLIVLFTSVVKVLVIDCTDIGEFPPTSTLPIFIFLVFFLLISRKGLMLI